MWKYFCLGLLVGWLAEWLIDWVFWRRKQYSRFDSAQSAAPAAGAASGTAINTPPAAAGHRPPGSSDLDAPGH